MYESVEILRIGTFVEINDKNFVITASRAHITKADEEYKGCGFPNQHITLEYRVLSINDEGDETGEVPVWFDSDMVDIKLI